MTLLIAGDYAVLRTQRMRFYYGYESAPADDLRAWSFEYEHGTSDDGGPRLVRYRWDELKLKDRFDVVEGLMRGIGRLIDEGYLQGREPGDHDDH